MPSLREITLEYHTQDILDGLDLPALQNLTFKYVDVINDGDPFRSLYSLILRSKPPLRVLESDSNVVHTDFFLSSLAKLDHLESLVIIEPFREGRGVYLSTDMVMSRLTSPAIAPQLKRLEFRFPSNHDAYPRGLLPSLRALQQSRKGCHIRLCRDTEDGVVEVGS
ncbi:uncharacterized protein SCHCODRAFT_084446 [Schizophyllum commune H4-8]|uniref:Expressed protein n=1 Tax=Schizophyllum commune (strain H4-8 / FGSC 9210) TaxID=578458 RepID=D8PVX1_SCHCM|nr:uncharacterized protein SCHCODRAFT_084446 [Schizophyllum commune H4-8]KAI5900180.1 hypothetical protein SCHCODRAFT_084446 [Schizophyllum commune H4-8]